jgi:hypothetical protein
VDTAFNPVALLFDARTEPTGSIVPGLGLPIPVATVTAPAVPIIGGSPTWSPLGSWSGACFDVGCGYTGWYDSNYIIGNTGTYILEFGVTNWVDPSFDSGLAIDGVTIGGHPVDAPPPPPVPEPGTLVLLGTGTIALIGRYRRGKNLIRRQLPAERV